MASTPDGAIRHFNGLAGYYLYHGGGPQELWQFSTSAGRLACGVVREETYWDYPGGTLYQPEAQDNWGGTIAPGLYQAIVGSSIAQPCFLQAPGSKVKVFSGGFDRRRHDRPGLARPALAYDDHSARGVTRRRRIPCVGAGTFKD